MPPEVLLVKPISLSIMKEHLLSRLALILASTLSLATAATATEQSDTGFDWVIMPSRVVDLGSPQSGLLQSISVDRGDTVMADQVVAELESRLEQANLAIATYRASTDGELGLREAAYEIDLRTEKRLKSLAASKVASAQDRDRAARDASLSAWRTRIAKEEQRLDALELARAQTALDRRRIRSPIDGVIVERMRNPGEYIEDQALLRIARLDPLHVEVVLPLRLFGQIQPGMRADVMPEFDELSNMVAIVDRVDPLGDAASGTFGARLVLPNPDLAIPAGMKCRADIDREGPLLSHRLRRNADGLAIIASESR
jgi:RND family efflux transporter MFP subunit